MLGNAVPPMDRVELVVRCQACGVVRRLAVAPGFLERTDPRLWRLVCPCGGRAVVAPIVWGRDDHVLFPFPCFTPHEVQPCPWGVVARDGAHAPQRWLALEYSGQSALSEALTPCET